MSLSLRHLECSGSYAEKESSYTINEDRDTVCCATTHLDQNFLTEQREEICHKTLQKIICVCELSSTQELV